MHRVAILVYPGFELLDAAGPASVFSGANHVLSENGQPAYYVVQTVSPTGGGIISADGIAVQTEVLSADISTSVDTFLVTGAFDDRLYGVSEEEAVLRWLPLCADASHRFGSICTGAFVLAALGLLNGKGAATHWMRCELFSQMYPQVLLDREALFVIDGKIWTSAGVTTGIDMALAMVAHDIDAATASHVAKGLVLYARRPGYQSQFSPLLRAQMKADDPFAELIGWIQSNLAHQLDVSTLASRSGLSERTFYRRFLKATRLTPGQFIEAARLDAARILLAQGLSIKVIADKVGLFPSSRLSRAFERQFGVSPSLYREMNGDLERSAFVRKRDSL